MPTRLSKRNALLALLFAVVCASIATACSSSKSDDGSAGKGGVIGAPKRDDVDVGLILRPNQLELLGTVAHEADSRPRKLTANDPVIFWELVNNAGKVVANGAVLDPRRAYSEFDANKKPAPREVITREAILNITLPNVGGMLHLYDSPRPRAPTGIRPLSINGGAEIAPAVAILQLAPGTSNTVLGAAAGANGAGDELGLGLQRTVDNTRCGDDFRILLVAEGYTDMAAFRRDAAGAIAQLQGIDGYADHTSQMTVFIQDFTSAEDGISDPDNKIVKNTAFNASFGTGDLRRCVYVHNGIPLFTAAKLWLARLRTKADIVGMVANTSEYGGCAGQQGGKPFITFTRDGSATEILAHEMGHGMFGLADEYDYGTCGAIGAPNVSASGTAPPWTDLLTTKTLPTTDTSDPTTVGAFEGAQYCKKGAFRPSPNCKMRELSAPFCKVCAKQMNTTFAARSTERRKPECKEDAGPPDAGGTGELDAGGNADAGGPSTDPDLYDSCVGRQNGVYCSQLVDYSSIVCEGETIASGQQCGSGKCLGPNGPGTTVQCEGGGGPAGDGGGSSGSLPTVDSCDGRTNGVYCSVASPGFALICTDQTVAGGLYCPEETPNCTGPNGAGAQVQCAK